MTRKVTVAAILVGLALYIGWDIYAVNQESGATISEVMLRVLWEHSSLAFAAGVILGHWTWPQESTRPGWQTALLVAGLGVVLFAIGLPQIHLALPSELRWPIVPLIVGMVAGHFIWPQRDSTATGVT